MRLIRTDTLSLEEFEVDPPRYAILSHVWGKEEVSLKDFSNANTANKQGYHKIQRFCETVRQSENPVDYVWVDTCCIDKSSSAELSEAINSMYNWYQDALGGCYAYLSDVTDLDQFSVSKWFTRGWTLQELLAPKHVEFYNSDWKLIGTKTTLASEIAAASGIDRSILVGQTSIHNRPIAQRMSWAAHRQTTRPEDRAYSLLGLFDINMPLLYGEGPKAFMRLQEEIIKQSSDDSIFAWKFPDPTSTSDGINPKYQSMGLLASSIEAFSQSQVTYTRKALSATDDYHLTNIGLSIPLILIPYSVGLYLVRLRCGKHGPHGTNWCYIMIGKAMSSDHFLRVRKDGSGLILGTIEDVETSLPVSLRGQLKHERVIVARETVVQDYVAIYNDFRLSHNNIDSYHNMTRGFPTNIYLHAGLTSADQLLPMPLFRTGTAAVIDISDLFDLLHTVIVKVGFDGDFNPCSVIMHEPIPGRESSVTPAKDFTLDVRDNSWIPAVTQRHEKTGRVLPTTLFQSEFTCNACQSIRVYFSRKPMGSHLAELGCWWISFQRVGNRVETFPDTA